MQTREIDRSQDVSCDWCHGRGCLACVEARAKRAKEIVLHINCTGEELDEVMAKVNGAVLRTTSVLVYATYRGPSREFEDFVESVERGDDDDRDTGDPPEIREMIRELARLKEQTQTSFTLDRIGEIQRRLAAHKAGVESIKQLFSSPSPSEPEPEPPAWLKKKPRRRKRAGIDAARQTYG